MITTESSAYTYFNNLHFKIVQIISTSKHDNLWFWSCTQNKTILIMLYSHIIHLNCKVVTLLQAEKKLPKQSTQHKTKAK